jgi:hypothetical protein
LTVINGNAVPFDFCAAWVDWNQDESFQNPAERIGVVPGLGPYVFQVMPPPDAPIGATRMRIRIEPVQEDPDPCGWPLYGEVEDYTVNVTAGFGACCTGCGTCTLELEQTCIAMGGTWLGEGVGCEPNPCNVVSYCWAGAQVCDEYISRVQIGTIDNPSGCEPNAEPPNYVDYTDLSTDLIVGTESALVVTNGNPFAGDHCAVWIDWNHNCEFSSSEKIAVLTGSGPYVFTITPPANAFVGQTWLRIRVNYYNPPEACGIETYGEVEDYTVNVIEATGACCWPDGLCTLELAAACGGVFKGTGTTCDPNPCVCPADLNCDGAVNFGDINPFVLMLSDFGLWQATYPNCPWRNGDVSGNGSVGFDDINPFVAVLVEAPIACAH